MNYRIITRVDWIVVHCAATPSDMDIGVKEIRHWHLQRGFSDVGYHYIIRRDGTMEKGRTDTTPGAHARGYNMNSLGICLVGGSKKNSTLAERNFTGAQYISLRKILTDLLLKFPDAELLGHRDLPGVTKACPSFDVRTWWNEEPDDADDTRTKAAATKAANARHTARQGRRRRHPRDRKTRI